jgi:hypothetical protein
MGSFFWLNATNFPGNRGFIKNNMSNYKDCVISGCEMGGKEWVCFARKSEIAFEMVKEEHLLCQKK